MYEFWIIKEYNNKKKTKNETKIQMDKMQIDYIIQAKFKVLALIW